MKFIKATLWSSALWPMLALAQFNFGYQGGRGGGQIGGFRYSFGGGSYSDPTRPNITSIDQVLEVLRNLIGWAQVIIAFIAIIFAIYAGLLFILQKSDDDIKKARSALIYAAVGFGIAILAYAVVPVVCTLLQASGPACSIF